MREELSSSLGWASPLSKTLAASSLLSSPTFVNPSQPVFVNERRVQPQPLSDEKITDGNLSPMAALAIEFSRTQLLAQENPETSKISPRTQRKLFADSDFEREAFHNLPPLSSTLPTSTTTTTTTTNTTTSTTAEPSTSDLSAATFKRPLPKKRQQSCDRPRSVSSQDKENLQPFEKPKSLSTDGEGAAVAIAGRRRAMAQSGGVPPKVGGLPLRRSGSAIYPREMASKWDYTPRGRSCLQVEESSSSDNPQPKKTRLSCSLEELVLKEDEFTQSHPSFNKANSDSLLTSPSKRTASLGNRRPLLPTEGGEVDLANITSQTMLRLLKGEFVSQVKKYVIVDCRFGYEYDGGHIHGAINISTPEELDDYFTQCSASTTTTTATGGDLGCRSSHTQKLTPMNPENTETAIIFHCEFSSHRGPNLARYLRSWDRDANRHNYPNLFYPNVYILSGGYKKFWMEGEEYKDFCTPRSYLPMDNPPDPEQLKEGKRKLREAANRRTRSCSSSGANPGLKPLRSMSTPSLFHDIEMAQAASVAAAAFEASRSQQSTNSKDTHSPTTTSSSFLTTTTTTLTVETGNSTSASNSTSRKLSSMPSGLSRSTSCMSLHPMFSTASVASSSTVVSGWLPTPSTPSTSSSSRAPILPPLL